MKLRRLQWFSSLVAALALFTHTLALAGAGGQERSQSARPKLIVLIVIDQFRADYIPRFEHLFGQNGFKRLTSRGAYFTDANYPYANTYTAVGHSTIVSGSIPAIHGVIANEWYD